MISIGLRFRAQTALRRPWLKSRTAVSDASDGKVILAKREQDRTAQNPVVWTETWRQR